MPHTTDGHNDQTTPDLGPAVPGPTVQPIPLEALAGLDAGEEWVPDPRDVDAVGRTMFDTPGSKDNSLVVLLPRESLNRVPAQSLLRIESREDDRTYLGIVTAGPFAEPDGLRADAPTIVTTAVRGATAFVPRYHGRVQVEILGERRSGALSPPRYRPLPNSPVFLLDSKESSDVLALSGNLRLGVVAGDDSLTIDIPADKKSVLPRHTGVLGTTGGGKSTTVSRIIDQAQRQGFAVILLDTEGEYTMMNEKTEDPVMCKLLAERGEEPHGVTNTRLYTLAGKRTSNPDHPSKTEFDLSFERFSPFVVQELLDLSGPQEERFSQAYEAAKTLLRELGVFPGRNNDGEKRIAMELNEFETGYPKMRLDHIIDVVRMVHDSMYDDDLDETVVMTADFRKAKGRLKEKAAQLATKTSHKQSWRALLGHLHRLRRLKVFDAAEGLDYDALLQKGQVSIFDLSDTDSPAINNLVIADVLRGVQDRQDEAYRLFEQGDHPSPTPVLVIIEEAHEFLSDERISKMPFLFQQVARIAKRGRKRWLGLVFVTQLPRHLPPQVLGLVNNWVLHRISDADTITRLRRSVANVDDSLWLRLPGLAPGQAIVSFTSMTRPLLAAIDPTPAKLRMLD
ncbi:MAG: ATP-binding protein [Solirubrobacteraceae bacterium]